MTLKRCHVFSITRSAVGTFLQIVCALLFLCSTNIFAQATETGVRFSVDGRGLKTLSYNGRSFISVPSSYDTIVTSALFTAPDGTEKPYGWLANSLGTINVGSAVKTTGTNPDYFQHVYRSGLADSFTVKMVWTSPDPKTAKVDIYVTNNDRTDTLSRFGLEYWLGGGPGFFTTPDLAPYNSLWWMIGADSSSATPVAFIKGNTWGSVALFTDDYSTHSLFYDVWTNSVTKTGTSNPVSYLFNLVNNASAGGAAANAKQDPIGPGQTWHYALYIRFGTLDDTPLSLAPEAFSAYQKALPNLVNWSDRRPITRWFIGDGARNSATNPRSYLWDDKLDVFPLTAEKQAVFNTRLLKTTDDIVTRMNGMDPKPQGIVIWDLEGDEFYHYLTYVGNPHKLHDLAPEMDAVADQMFKKFTDAGYKVGMTLRPSLVETGTVLPTTCTSNATNTDLRDVFIKTNEPYPYRGYSCAVTAACGSANRSYAATDTSFGTDTFCTTGTLTPSSITFPLVGKSASWTCHDPVSGKDTPCTASRAVSKCGSAGTTYPLAATGFGNGTLCSEGEAIPESVSFPSPGGSVNWKCKDSVTKVETYCSAFHASPACGTANKVYPLSSTSFGTDTFCSTGAHSPAAITFPAAHKSVQWTCEDPAGGKVAVCYAARDTSWRQEGARLPHYQTCSHDDAKILDNLRTKVTYAKNRWGAKLFYVDSTVYCGNGGGGSFNFEIFRQLQKEFPDVIFFPENEAYSWYGTSAPYNQVNMGSYEAPGLARDMYPQAFSVLANYDGVKFSDPAVHDRLVRSVKQGNIFMIDAWWGNPTNTEILKIHRDAGYSGSKPFIASFAASAPGAQESGSTLTWSVFNAASVSIDQGIGDVTKLESKSVFPVKKTTYTLTATNASGSTTATATVVLIPKPPQSLRTK